MSHIPQSAPSRKSSPVAFHAKDSSTNSLFHESSWRQSFTDGTTSAVFSLWFTFAELSLTHCSWTGDYCAIEGLIAIVYSTYLIMAQLWLFSDAHRANLQWTLSCADSNCFSIRVGLVGCFSSYSQFSSCEIWAWVWEALSAIIYLCVRKNRRCLCQDWLLVPRFCRRQQLVSQSRVVHSPQRTLRMRCHR